MRERKVLLSYERRMFSSFSVSLKTHVAIMSENNYSDTRCYDHNVYTGFSHDGEQSNTGLRAGISMSTGTNLKMDLKKAPFEF